MSQNQLQQLRDLVEGIAFGILMDAGVPRERAVVVSRDAGSYTVGQVKDLVCGSKS